MTDDLDDTDDFDDASFDEKSSPPVTDLDMRMIIAALHDQGRGHVLADMIESVTGERLPEGTFHPRKFPIRDPQWRAARKRLKKQRDRLYQRERQSSEAKAARIAALEEWKATHPDRMEEAGKRRQAALKQERKARQFVAVDLEGFNTGRYFTDDRRDYAREMHEGIARGDTTYEQACEQIKYLHVSEEEKYNPPFDGWTVHDHKWYLDQHNLTPEDPYPSPRNKKPGTPDIYIEHRPFLFGAGNDQDRLFVTFDDLKKIALSGRKILETICDLRERFGEAIFVTFAFGYDVSQILRCLDADTAGQLQAGEIIIKSIDEDGAPCEEVIEQATFFWNEFALSYRRGKMFRVGRLNDPAKPYVYTEVTDPERRQAYIDAGRDPVTRKIDYKHKPVTLNDTFGFFQMSFVEAYESSGISFTLEEAKIIVEGKRKRRIMASLPMEEVKLYQEMELRVLCRMTDKLRETTVSLGLDLPHWQGAGAISSAMATKHRARDFYPKIKADNHLPVQEWAHYCFAGGRIEMVKQGRHTGDAARAGPVSDALNSSGAGRGQGGERRKAGMSYGFDITSAYPSIQYVLAAMAIPIEWEMKKDGSLGKVKRQKEGKWIWREGAELTEDIIRTMSIYSMIEVEFAFPEKCFDPKTKQLRKAAFYPLFYRRQDGSILFPAKGIGRYYRDELLAAFEWVRQSRPDMNEQQHARMLKLRGGWEFICPTIYDLTAEELEALKRNCPSARISEDGLVYPFHYIKEYYDQRALYPKTDARNKILKLGINGAWGKTAQSVGGRHGIPPRDASPWYAGVVTAGTRAKCVRAALKAPWNIIHFATDGIQSDAP